MEEEYYIGQIFEGEYPQGAADFCNKTQTAMIIEIESIIIDEQEVRRFQIVEVPTHTPTKEEITKLRRQYRQKHIDDETARRSRKIANKSWTEEDETAYLALDVEVTSYIEEHYPYAEEDK